MEHNNLYESGVEGILSDFRGGIKAAGEPLYIRKIQIDFDETGKIQRIDTFYMGRIKRREKYIPR